MIKGQMPHEDPIERLKEDLRALDVKVEQFIAAYERAPRGRRFDMYRNLDKGRSEISVAGHWIDEARKTIERMIELAANGD